MTAVPATACSLNRSYPTLCQAQAYIDGLNAAGQTGEYSVVYSPDRYAPCGAWYEVHRKFAIDANVTC